jgi:hypothetical protein
MVDGDKWKCSAGDVITARRGVELRLHTVAVAKTSCLLSITAIRYYSVVRNDPTGCIKFHFSASSLLTAFYFYFSA